MGYSRMFTPRNPKPSKRENLMADPEELKKDEIIEALEKSNAKLSNLLAISEYQKDHLKTLVAELRQALAEEISKNSS